MRMSFCDLGWEGKNPPSPISYPPLLGTFSQEPALVLDRLHKPSLCPKFGVEMLFSAMPVQVSITRFLLECCKLPCSLGLCQIQSRIQVFVRGIVLFGLFILLKNIGRAIVVMVLLMCCFPKVVILFKVKVTPTEWDLCWSVYDEKTASGTMKEPFFFSAVFSVWV